MKTLFVAAAIATSLASGVALADDPAQLATQAATAYGARDYNAPGIKSAQLAADLYGQAAAAATDVEVKATDLTAQSSALFFVGDATADKTAKIAALNAGITAGDQAVKLLGIADVTKVADADLAKLKATLPADQLLTLCTALYARGTNLGDWGQANGVMQSLGKWPELRRSMEMIEILGHVEVQNYGAYRILGRGYYKIPSLLGGDMNKAAKYLSTAVSKTLVAGQKFSKNGFNNIYYADVLHAQGNDDDASALLNDFIKADPNTVDPTSVAETRQNQKDATDDMNGW